MKWAVIGAGGIADRRSIPAILLNPDNTLVALMDRVPDVAEKMGVKYSCPSFTSEEEMLAAHPEVEAIYIGTPVMCHVSQAMLGLKYGKPVFMEKPVAMNGTEAEALVDAFKKAGVQLTIGYMMSYHNLHQKARQIVSEGLLGKVVDVRAQFGCWYPDIPGAWRQKKALGGGGAIMDLAVHCIELVENVLQDRIIETKSMYSTSVFNYEVEDGGVIIFRTQKGTLGHIDVNFNIPDKAVAAKFEIYGTSGSIILTDTLSQDESGKMEFIYAPQGDYDAAQKRTTNDSKVYMGEMGNIYRKQIDAFCKTVSCGKPDYTNADEAVHIQKLIDEIYGL